MVGKFALAALGFVGTIVFARVLGPQDFGGFYLLLAIARIATRPVSGVAAAAKQRFASGAHSREEILGAMWIAVAIGAAIALVGGVTVSPWLIPRTGIEDAGLLFVVLFVSTACFESAQTILSATGRLSLESATDVLGSLVTLPVQVGLVLLGLGVMGMTVGFAVGNLVAAIVSLVLLGVRPIRPSGEVARSLWTYARFSIPSRFFNKAYARLDIVIIGAVISSTAAGYYEVGYKLTMPALYLSTVIGSGVFARVGNNYSLGERDAMLADIRNSRTYSGILSLPLIAGALVVGELVITTLYGPEYSPAAELLVWIAVYQFLRSQTIVLDMTLEGIDAPAKSLWSSVIATVVNIVLGVPAAMYVGAVGIVVATVVAELVRFVVTRVYVGRALDTDLTEPNLRPQFAATGLMATVVYLLRETVSGDTAVYALSLVFVGAVVYSLSLITVSTEFRVTVRGILREVKAKLI